MSESPPEYTLSEQQPVSEEKQFSLEAIRSDLFSELLTETAELLHTSPELVQDVIVVVCVERDKPLKEVLDVIHSFFKTFTTLQASALPEPQPVESPYLRREV